MLLGDVKTIENQLHQQFKSNSIDFEFSLLVECLYVVTDAMRRESAIANDFWDETLSRNVNDQVEVTLKNIEQK
jgi:hypothetical protein